MQEQVNAQGCISDRKPTRSCRLRPSRSTDHAITMSNCCLVAISAERVEGGTLVAALTGVAYTELTDDGMLRHPSFKGLKLR